MKVRALLITVFLSFLCCRASSQAFKGHRIGETAEQFFSIARMAEHNTPARQYCQDYLANPKVLRAYGRVKTHPDDTRAVALAIDVDGCRDVQSALGGQSVKVDARYAAELGGGWAEFNNARLLRFKFSLKKEIPFEDVVTDIGKELGGAESTTSLITRQVEGGAIVQERRAVWSVEHLHVQADEVKDYEFGGTEVAVTVAGSEYLKEKEATRPSTIR